LLEDESMFKHLLVPLDGSRLAEAALPAAAHVAEALGASVTLVHVIERDAPREIHGERHLSNPDEAYAYLGEVAHTAFGSGVHVEQHVHTAEVRDVARSIAEHTGELGPDLIVMCTHGWGGVRGWLFGSIAQQVIGLGGTPVLLVQPSRAGGTPLFACRRLLVPLDGDPDHEQGLRVAAGLARACGAELHLVRVVPTLGTLPGEQATSARLLPGVTSALLDLDEEGAQRHLQQQAAQLEQQGLLAKAEVARGDPALVIVRSAEKAGADLIVMGTHGKAGMEAFWSESVAPQVCSRARVPLLLVPVLEAA
jgi:nucleotide-binding universal stress UspA family protein